MLHNIRAFSNWPSVYLGTGNYVKLRNGLSFRLASRHDIPIIKHVITDRSYGPFDGGEKIIVDIGANVGTFSVLASRECPHATVYAFEPCARNFSLLEHNIKANRSNVIPIKKAVAPERGIATLYLTGGGDSGHHSLIRSKRNTVSEEKVECVTLDDIIDQVGDIDFLKIDIEGMEDAVLNSCTQLHRVKRIEKEKALKS